MGSRCSLHSYHRHGSNDAETATLSQIHTADCRHRRLRGGHRRRGVAWRRMTLCVPKAKEELEWQYAQSPISGENKQVWLDASSTDHVWMRN